MILQLDDTWRILTDEHSWMVQKYRGEEKNKKTGELEPRWESKEWHMTFEKAVESLSERCQRDISAELPQDIVRELRRLTSAVQGLRQAYLKAVQPVD